MDKFGLFYLFFFLYHAVISLANSILIHVGLPRKVSTLKQCNSLLFSQLYETLTGNKVPSLTPRGPTSEAVKCQAVVNALNIHLQPHVTLDHIQGSDVAQFDLVSIKNLLDIFSVLFHVPLTVGDAGNGCLEDGRSDTEMGENADDEANDSNMISSEGMSVISEVLREELGGHSSHSAITDSTAELVRPVPMARLPAGVFKTTNVVAQTDTRNREGSSVGARSTEGTSATISSQPPSLTISSLHSTSTEESRIISQVGAVAQGGSVSTGPGANGRLRGRAASVMDAKLTDTNVKTAMIIPSGESSIGTTPSPTLHQLHTPPQSPGKSRQQLSPLHHSTPHTSTRSRLFPTSAIASTAASSAHPLTHSTAVVTPSVTGSRQQRIKVFKL